MRLLDAVTGFVLARRFAHLPGLDRIEIKAIDANQNFVRFETSPEVLVDYPFSFFFDRAKSHVVLNGTHRVEGDEVVCEVSKWVSGTAAKNVGGFVNGWLGNTPADFGFDATELMLRNGRLELPATLKKAGNDWVILVHGRTARRAETYRAFKIFADLGLSCLAVSLRNNFESTTSRARVSHFGVFESGDLAVAVDYAREHGAKRVLIYAISMGAVAISEYLRGGGYADAIILDSPALDWQATLECQGRAAGVGQGAVDAGINAIESPLLSRLIGLSMPIDLRAVGFSNWANEFELPMLILHSLGDSYVPIEPALKLSIEHASNVSIEIFEKAHHVQLFNQDSERYRNAISSFWQKLTT